MSWITKINEVKLEIITGDGKSYFPLWKNAEKEIKYNTEAYDFANVSGTYIDRKLPQGGQYPLLLWFQGDDNLDKSKTFKDSADDPRPWTVRHPYYDDILVQPLGLRFNNIDHNVTEITGTVWETLPSKFPVISVNPEKDIQERKTAADEYSNESILNEIGTPETGAVEPAKLSVDVVGKLYEVLGNAEELNNLIRTAKGAALNLISKPAEYLTAIQALIDFPLSVEDNALLSLRQIEQAVYDLFSILDLSYFDQQSSTLITTSCLVSVLGTYETRKDVLEANQRIVNMYNFIILKYDEVEYAQNDETSLNLYTIVNLTVQQLFEIAFNAKQERTYILERDDSMIALTHRFLGGMSDENLEKFQAWNDLSIDEILEIKKGREIIYYK